MAPRLLTALGASLAALIAPAASATALPPPIPQGRALAALAAHDHALLALKPGRLAERLVRARGGDLVSAALDLWRVGGGEARRLVPVLASRHVLRYAEADRERRSLVHLDQGDPLLGLAWHIEQVGADRVEPPGPGAALTLIDAGLDVNHPEFSTRPDVELLNRQSVGEFGSDDYHGTIVASIAGAPSDGVGTVGVYPRVLLRSYDLRDLEDSSIIAALDFAIARGPGVINLSLGGRGSLARCTRRFCGR